jgi:glucose/arabinose dehydrogenase
VVGRALASGVCALVLAGLVATPGSSLTGASERQALSLRLVASGLEEPVHATAPRGERGRLYVVERAGRVRVLENGAVRAQPFLDIRRLVGSAGGEQGLLSLAFHPRYAQNRRLYVNYTDRSGHTRVVEYRSNGRVARTGTRRQLLLVRQPYGNHNGGQLAFGPNGRLYVGMGDGGSGGDPHDHGQRIGTLLGTLLTIDVDRRGARPQVVGYGLRNPWRFSFDRRNGDLYLADVGQNAWEEVNYVPRRPAGLVNFGWRVYEGRARFSGQAPNPRGRLVHPVHAYGRGAGCSVTGGFVYRGSAVPAARGRYFFGDYCTGTVWSFTIAGGQARQVRTAPFQVPWLSSFGEDAAGELFLLSLRNGTVHRLAR